MANLSGQPSYTRPSHTSPATDSSATDATVLVGQLQTDTEKIAFELLASRGAYSDLPTRLAASGAAYTTTAIVVASADASSAVKAGANYVCDGTNDQAEINSAIDLASALFSRNALMPGGAAQVGKVQLSGGRFNCGGSILMRTGVTLAGNGFLTEVRAVNISAATGSGAALALIKLAANTDHLCHVRDMWLNGNFAGGGTNVHGIHFDMTSGTPDTTTYPATDPDAYHFVSDLFITGFTTGTRHGIWMYAAATANNRSNMVRGIEMRNSSGDGIRFDGASDSFITQCHIGGSGGSAYYVGGGNTKVANCKSFYSNTHGFWFVSGRCIATGLESQDDFQGIFFDGSPCVASGLVVDTPSDTGITVSTSKLVISGFEIFNRGGGRYATTTTGLFFDATYTDLQLTGNVEPTSVTTPITGAAGARSFMRVSNGTTLVSVG